MSSGAHPAAPGPLGRAIAAQATTELRLTLRRGENLLAVAIIPPAVLAFFASSSLVGGPDGPGVEALFPGALALALIATGLPNLGIATAYERHYGVLKRLGASPLPRGGLLAGKLAAVVVVEVVQVALLVAVAVALGWAPGPGASIAVGAVAFGLGTIAFSSLGLLLAGTLRAEATLAFANGLFLGLLLIGGILVPAADLPELLGAIAAVLPAAALTDLFRVATGAAPADAVVPALPILAAWAAGLALAAARWFRWD